MKKNRRKHKLKKYIYGKIYMRKVYIPVEEI